MALSIHRMFRVHELDGMEKVGRGTVTWMHDDEAIRVEPPSGPEHHVFAWVPDGGERVDIRAHFGVPQLIEKRLDDPEKTVRTLVVGERRWNVYNELPVTAPTIHMTVASVRSPVKAVVAPTQTTFKKE